MELPASSTHPDTLSTPAAIDMDDDVQLVAEDYISPRSKVARLLADLDDGPTPPSSPVLQQASPRHSTIVERQAYSSDDDSTPPAGPIGRAARRMRQKQPVVHEYDELYDASPMRTRILPSLTITPTTPAEVSSRQSPGLFVSPTRSDSEDELPVLPIGTARLAALVAAKRTERLERERLQKEMAAQRSVRGEESGLPEQMVEDSAAPAQHDLEKILSDAAKPTRKASKKALLEMQRETQRMAREQALAHQMKTKKKFSTSDLFARFNFRQSLPQQQDHSGSSSVPNSDGFSPAPMAREPFSTPPSSPPTTPFDAQKAMVDRGALARMMPVREDSINTIASLQEDNDDDELPSADDIINHAMAAKASAKQMPVESPSKTAAQRFRSRIRDLSTRQVESDDELDIVQPMPSHLRTFDRVKPASSKGEAHSKAIHALKHLAHLNHDNTTVRGRKLKTSVAHDTVNANLLATARAQARQAQQKRLAELQAKGIVIMSAEEQEKEADQMENLIEQARAEAEALRKKERAARKGDNEVGLEASDDEDEDWQDSEADVELSDAEDDDPDEESRVKELIDAAASEDEASVDELELETPVVVASRKRVRVVLDDDDNEEEEEEQIQIDKATGVQEDAAEDDPFAAFGFGDGPALMSPTQAFAATMQTPTQLMHSQSHASSFRAPPPTFGQLPSQNIRDSMSQLVSSSQLQDETQQIELDWETQMPETPVAEGKRGQLALETPGWEPSQDAGLPSPWAAVQQPAELSVDHETQSTVVQRISQTPELTQPRQKGRLKRGTRRVVIEDSPAPDKSAKNAFSEMQKLRMQSLNATERAVAEKEMKDMMDDQAEESEDEYAGLGGDDSNMIAPETEEDRAMIDESNIEIDEQQAQDMAKFYAERQRAAEEEATSKLFKDLTTGALRRRQGVGWELDEDEDDLAVRRRQIRLREEARKRRLLLQDDNVKGLLNGKGDSQAREAFLRTIGDDEDDYEEVSQLETSQDISSRNPLAEISSNKRKLDGTQQDGSQSKIRRTGEDNAFSRPTSLLQIQESLSFLLEEPAHALQAPTYADDAEVELEENDGDDELERELSRDNNGGYAPDQVSMPPPPLPTDRLPASQRRTPAKPTVIDRLSLRRGSSSGSSSSSNSWSAWSTGSGPNKAPSLLRKATSNLSASNTNDRGVSYGNDARAVAPAVKTGGSKKSSLAYQSRAQERKAMVERAEKKKEDSRRRIADLRRQQGGGLVGNSLNGGQWE